MTINKITHCIETIWDPETESKCIQFRLDGQRFQVSGKISSKVWGNKLEVKQLQVWSGDHWTTIPLGTGKAKYIIGMLRLEGIVATPGPKT